MTLKVRPSPQSVCVNPILFYFYCRACSYANHPPIRADHGGQFSSPCSHPPSATAISLHGNCFGRQHVVFRTIPSTGPVMGVMLTSHLRCSSCTGRRRMALLYWAGSTRGSTKHQHQSSISKAMHHDRHRKNPFHLSEPPNCTPNITECERVAAFLFANRMLLRLPLPFQSLFSCTPLELYHTRGQLVMVSLFK